MSSLAGTLKITVRLMRPRHWVKNLFVLAPLFFSAQFTSPQAVIQAVQALIVFCLAASAAYVFNDCRDLDHDRRHPVKSRTRPLASGDISLHRAYVLLLALYFLILGFTATVPQAVWVAAAYLVLNVLYALYLKHQPVLDIFSVALGFVLRVYAGAVVLEVPLSAWMLVTTLSLALYLAALKRRQELLHHGRDARPVLQHYTIALVDKYAALSATCSVLFYSLFVITEQPSMVLSVLFVIFGLYRYWFVVELKDKGESPVDALYSDRQLQLAIVGWILACGYVLVQ